MLERLRTQIGTAGLIVAIVALVAALGGGAYAATGGNSGGKATASAKQGKQGKQGKTGKTGPAGPAGPAGSAGAKGDAGAAGSSGSNGAPGAAGKSVVVVNEAPPGCSEGGFTYEVQGSGTENEVCNGETGEAGAIHPGETLPSGASETGIWSFSGSLAQAFIKVPLSFAIPLSAPLEAANTINATQSKTECGADATCLSALAAKCPATSGSQAESVKNPTAASGFLCWYRSGLIVNAALPSPGNNFSRAGTFLQFEITGEPAVGSGSWAVTAP